MSESANDTPQRIIWRCVPSPHSNSKVSPSRTRARAETLRSTVGRAAEVPRNVTLNMGANIRTKKRGDVGKRGSKTENGVGTWGSGDVGPHPHFPTSPRR